MSLKQLLTAGGIATSVGLAGLCQESTAAPAIADTTITTVVTVKETYLDGFPMCVKGDLGTMDCADMPFAYRFVFIENGERQMALVTARHEMVPRGAMKVSYKPFTNGSISFVEFLSQYFDKKLSPRFSGMIYADGIMTEIQYNAEK